MKNLSKSARETFDNISLSKKQEERILNNILERKNNICFAKPIIIGSILISFGATLGIVYADDIKRMFNTLIIKEEIKENNNGDNYTIVKSKSEGIIRIKDNANIDNLNKIKSNNKIELKLNDLENELGVKILKSTLYPFEYITQESIELKNNKITQASFSISNISNELPDEITEAGELQFYRDYTECNMNIYFKTQFFDSSDTSLNSIAPRGTRTENYYINKLDTTALIVKFEPEENSRSKVWDIIFDYKNITYKFTFFFHGTDPKSEITRILNSLEL